jgi:hypothetical protein
MIRVHVVCEGQTEAAFVRYLLCDALDPLKISLMPSLIGRPGHKGGNFKSDRLLPDVRERPHDGLLASIKIGIDTIRRECRLFDSWLIRLENLRQ